MAFERDVVADDTDVTVDSSGEGAADISVDSLSKSNIHKPVTFF